MSDFLARSSVEPIENLSLVDKVEFRLMELLSQGKLGPGDMLPKEVELADAFNVSRTVVREALTRLKVMGLVESIKHKGSMVTHPDVLTNLERILQPQVLDEETLRDIFEIRLVLEVGMADLLFARVEDAHIEELEEIVQDEPPEGGIRTVFDRDFEVRFHGKLYEISDNRTLQRFQKMLLPVFEYVHKSGMLRELTPEGAYVSHRELVRILRNGTPKRFREAMRAHLHNHFKRLD
jgi:DNA-binding FadR family transcriptional regulator